MHPTAQPVSMHARLLRRNLLGSLFGVGTNGYLAVNGRSVSWTETAGGARPPSWQVDASEITIPREPAGVNPELEMFVRDQPYRYQVDLVPVSAFTRGLIISARRGNAARAMASAIFQAQA